MLNTMCSVCVSDTARWEGRLLGESRRPVGEYLQISRFSTSQRAAQGSFCVPATVRPCQWVVICHGSAIKWFKQSLLKRQKSMNTRHVDKVTGACAD